MELNDLGHLIHPEKPPKKRKKRKPRRVFRRQHRGRRVYGTSVCLSPVMRTWVLRQAHLRNCSLSTIIRACIQGYIPEDYVPHWAENIRKPELRERYGLPPRAVGPNPAPTGNPST